MIETTVRDIRYALRTLRKNPAFAIVTVGTLALAIGANTAIFSVIDAVILRPLGYKDPSRLVPLVDGTTYSDFLAWKSQNRVFSDMAAYYRLGGRSRVTLTGSGEPESVQGGFVTSNFFPLLGVPPLIGRWFDSQEEARQERVIVLAYSLWNRRFGASPDVVGKTLNKDGANCLVVGVMPPTFQFPVREVEFWAPITTNRYWGEIFKFDPNYSRYAYARWDVIARLRPGVTVDQARTEMATINDRLEKAVPDRNRAPTINVSTLRVSLSGNTQLALYVLFGAVSFVLLIACSNVANLVLARGAARGREMAMRTALGAGRSRLARQLFTESLVLALLSACIGVVFAEFGIRAIVALGPPDIPRLGEAGLDPGVLSFALIVSILSAILFGLFPALEASRPDPKESLRSVGRGIASALGLTRTRSLLIVVEFAMAVILLAGAGLLMRSFLAVQAVDPGFRPEHVITMRVTLPASTTATRRSNLDDLTLERLRAIPEVRAVGAIDSLLNRQPGDFGLRIVEGRPPEPRQQWTPLDWTTIRGDYFEAMGGRLLAGRLFAGSDTVNAPLVVIVDETMARRYWPGESPIGKRFKGFDSRGHDDDWLTVIGVVQDMRRHGRERSPAAHIFQWYRQATDNSTPDLVVRTVGDPKTLASTLRDAVRSLDESAILYGPVTLEDQLSDQLSPRRFQMSLVSLFALVALVLACVGMYGIMHYSVLQRTHEIGVRMALGARAADLLRMVIGRATLLASVGLVIGLSGAWWLTRMISSLLYGVKPSDPLTLGAVSILIIAVAALASLIPAWRATRMDPLSALRVE
jgi:predicted permease